MKGKGRSRKGCEKSGEEELRRKMNEQQEIYYFHVQDVFLPPLPLPPIPATMEVASRRPGAPATTGEESRAGAPKAHVCASYCSLTTH